MEALKTRHSCWGVNGFDISERLFQSPNMSRPFETSKYLSISEKLFPSQLEALIENISIFLKEFSKLTYIYDLRRATKLKRMDTKTQHYIEQLIRDFVKHVFCVHK